MADALEKVDETTLLIFDLDNTVIKPAQTLGTDQWYAQLVKQYLAAGESENEAIEKAISVWASVQKVTRVVPVESVTPNLIRQKQGLGIQVMALTARPLELISTTDTHLKSVGVDFTKNPVFDRPLSLKSDEAARFERGILFVGPKNNKGKVLVQFFEETGISPKRIVFVDDKLKHVRHMEEAMSTLPAEYLGFRYGATDQEVANFDESIAKVQLRYFAGILDDDSAKKLLAD